MHEDSSTSNEFVVLSLQVRSLPLAKHAMRCGGGGGGHIILYMLVVGKKWSYSNCMQS